MSSAMTSWSIISARSIICTLHGKGRLYSRCFSSQKKVAWRSLLAKGSFSFFLSSCSCSMDSVFTVRKAFRHTSTEEEDFSFHLTPSQINDILRANELSITVPEFDGKNPSSVLKFESNHLAANTPSEDRRSAATCLQTRGMMFGVFDGHAGYACAQSVSERLFFYIAVSLLSQQTLEEIESAMESMKPVLPILQWHKHPNDRFFQEVASLYLEQLRVYWQDLLNLDMEPCLTTEEALTYAFKRLDSDISLEVQAPSENELIRNIALQVAFSGATACVAHIDSVNLHVANTGDCRAILGVQNKDGAWSALSLTRDHNAFNKSETLRLKREHPSSEEDTLIVNNRLLGVLMPSRAFGDVRFKWSQELQHNVLGNGCNTEALNIYEYVPPNYHTPPYLTAEPEVTYHKIRQQDKFLVIASDGLWDMLSNEEVVKLVAEHLLEGDIQKTPLAFKKPPNLGYMQNLLLQRKAKHIQSSDQNVATHLIRHAVGNNEHGEIDPEKLVAMLTLPDDLARMYRDDITVTVIYFDSDIIEGYYRENE
ncbi:pyruvate dehydrogenase [acetyl-transferring]-phosphatase 2, mitochondrial [Rhineura floridana]|uniref:pyruvate dehydrogenase [acetyl-transferring]-phosphatase 2, mitochondrial n=1 Tax=Rhineura floridana TaxID=261503 RepID=UPI002AC7F8EF|nr:pyruvate dehydrogenase [acetyl-transferring]-phosphatase 2, mitochondrial [Rhineura floridana]XP_061450219.1 pyruvate dehydrogenase [acetyl-transferring]-phosphatase 2, mitochondrial [Rhineura floridana]XP_061450220.1 pyruvate dehydrogenase [acetyl-transferring]-phosphatase 2, mitochondrial [Rhineura floridana]XP_061450221.1 pyruvate dehydrogenase [acetyl-transferring]-phosphatase 2, mitochondrial [Rhineura floridana]XP_061450222.1 pyruvate dehydrogenase [acetyl-transferring]-phosphatase 2, 